MTHEEANRYIQKIGFTCILIGHNPAKLFQLLGAKQTETWLRAIQLRPLASRLHGCLFSKNIDTPPRRLRRHRECK